MWTAAFWITVGTLIGLSLDRFLDWKFPVKSEKTFEYNEIAQGYSFEKDFEEWKRNR